MSRVTQDYVEVGQVARSGSWAILAQYVREGRFERKSCELCVSYDTRSLRQMSLSKGHFSTTHCSLGYLGMNRNKNKSPRGKKKSSRKKPHVSLFLNEYILPYSVQCGGLEAEQDGPTLGLLGWFCIRCRTRMGHRHGFEIAGAE